MSHPEYFHIRINGFHAPLNTLWLNCSQPASSGLERPAFLSGSAPFLLLKYLLKITYLIDLY
jgi:hypothetical protein